MAPSLGGAKRENFRIEVLQCQVVPAPISTLSSPWQNTSTAYHVSMLNLVASTRLLRQTTVTMSRLDKNSLWEIEAVQ